MYSRDELFFVLTQVLFCCLFPSLLRNSGNKQQDNALVSTETFRHSGTYIILNIYSLKNDPVIEGLIQLWQDVCHRKEPVYTLQAICVEYPLVTSRFPSQTASNVFYLMLAWSSCWTNIQVDGDFRWHYTHVPSLYFIMNNTCLCDRYQCSQEFSYHTMDMLWEKFQWILPLYMKPISFRSKASVVCSVTTVVFIDFCLKKLNVFSQHIGQKQMNIWIPQTK